MAFFGRLGANLASVSFVSEPCRHRLGRLWPILGTSLPHLGIILSWGFEECLAGILGPLWASWGASWDNLGGILGQSYSRRVPRLVFGPTFDLFATRGVILGPISHNFFGCVLRKFGDHFGSRSAQERVNMGPRGPSRGSKT
jgi:hypothetical protein